MPKLKYEFMHQYYKTHRRHLRDYLFGYFHVVSKWLTPIAPLANGFMRMDWSRKIIAGAMGITDRRPFPLFVKRAHTQKAAPAKKQVIFLADVFSRYLEPQVEKAAFDILSAAGYEVKVLPVVGAGASLLSKGFIEAARKHAEKVIAEITALGGAAGLCVVGCEPPEVYCLKHEYVALLPEMRAEIEALSKNVWLLDEFLLRADVLNDLRVVTKERLECIKVSDRRIAFHPHCHQRAEGLAEDGLPSGSSATVALLRAFGFDVDVIDAGCCGMAGTFGYDAEHYDLSMQVGELKLFPALRQLKTENQKSSVVSSGSACRLQIKQGADITARHPLEVIANLIASKEKK